MKPLIIYHADCPDGFAAAFAAWLKFGADALYVPAKHGDAAPEVSGHDVFILDFSYSEAVLQELAAKAASLTVLDHHLSSKNALRCFSPSCGGHIVLDLSRSGAVLAWRHFHPETPLPALFKYVQDRDLWTWEMPRARDYLAWLDLQPRTMQRWEEILGMSEGEVDKAIELGKVLNQKFEMQCRELADLATPVSLDGHAGLAVNAPAEFSSELGSLLAVRSGTFGLVWHADSSGIRCSLRAVDYDVEQLARRFGGGGHLRAAGFRLKFTDAATLLEGTLQSRGRSL